MEPLYQGNRSTVLAMGVLATGGSSGVKGLRRTGAALITGPRCLLSVRRRGEREPDLQAGVPGHRCHPQVSVVAVHDDPPRDVESQPGALADRLCRKERLED